MEIDRIIPTERLKYRVLKKPADESIFRHPP